jgi:hypothetical protein
MDNEEILEMLIDKLVEAKIENFKLSKKNKDLENMNKAANEIIKNLKLENTTLRNNIKL